MTTMLLDQIRRKFQSQPNFFVYENQMISNALAPKYPSLPFSPSEAIQDGGAPELCLYLHLGRQMEHLLGVCV